MHADKTRGTRNQNFHLNIPVPLVSAQANPRSGLSERGTREWPEAKPAAPVTRTFMRCVS
jgi:hypothetical protein